MYPCSICKFKALTVASYNSHQTCHKHLVNVRFKCVGCIGEFSKFANSNQHVYGIHPIRRIESNDLLFHKCSVSSCSFEELFFKELYTHTFEHIKNGSSVKCSHLNCIRVNTLFKKYLSLSPIFIASINIIEDVPLQYASNDLSHCQSYDTPYKKNS